MKARASRFAIHVAKVPFLALTFFLVHANTHAQGRAAPVFVDGQAQLVPAFQDSTLWIRHRLWVETEFDSDRDGKRDRVHVDVTRPRQTDTEGLKVPVIYESSPYFAGTSGPRESLWDVKHELGATPPPRKPQPPIPYGRTARWISNSHVPTWLPRGFAVVHSEAPGTGQSQGCVTIGDQPELLAPKAVIDWLNGRARGYTTPDGNEEVRASWSTGKVGMTGTSYDGTIPVAAAATGVAGLEAIIPIAPNTSYYHYYRSNGLVRHPDGWLGEDIDFLYDFVNSGHPDKRDHCNKLYRDGEFAAGRDRVTGDFNDFWARRDLLPLMKNVKAATLMAHAFNDWNVVPEHSVRIVEALRKQGTPVQVYFHQGGHGGPPPLPLMNRWFTRYLYGIENGVEKDAKSWIVREGARANDPTAYPDYPHPDAATVTLRPTTGGRGVGTLSLTQRGSGREAWTDDVSLSGEALAQAAQSQNRLLYATPVLTQPVHISGTPKITVSVSSTKPAANLSVWLVALPFESNGPNRAFNVITRGWADPQNHRSLTRGEPLRAREFYTVTFNLQPDDQIIPAGKRMALMIFSSDRGFTLWPEPGTQLTVDLSQTALELPVVGGQNALRQAFASVTSDPEQRRRRVESGLLPPVTIRGSNSGCNVDERMKMYQVPGVSVAVINNGRIEWAKGYGVVEAGQTRGVDTTTLFQAASISKPVAAMAALKLVEQGRLTLDDDVNQKLASWRVPENAFTRAQPVTLRRLLSHNAGLTVHGFRGYAAGETVPTVVQILNGEKPANSAAVRADTTPGAIWRYSGGGTTVVQLLMQDVSGKAFPELVREYVLTPAGMIHSGYEQPIPTTRASSAAVGHRANGQAVTGKWHTYPEMFAAGLWTTPSDLARLAIEVQRSLRGESNRILSREMTQQMLTRQAGEYGLGFGVGAGDGWRVFSHGGANEGFRATLIAFSDRGQGAVIMTNGDNGPPLYNEILRAIAKEYDWPTFRAIERDTVHVSTAQLERLAGEYTLIQGNLTRTVTIRVNNGALVAIGLPGSPAGVERPLFALAPDRFFHVMDARIIRFEPGAEAVVLEGVGPALRLTRRNR